MEGDGPRHTTQTKWTAREGRKLGSTMRSFWLNGAAQESNLPSLGYPTSPVLKTGWATGA